LNLDTVPIRQGQVWFWEVIRSTNGCDQFWGMTGNSDVTRLGKGSRRYARNVLGTNAASMPLRKSQAPCFQTHTAFIYIASRDGQQTPKRVTFIGRSSQLPSDH